MNNKNQGGARKSRGACLDGEEDAVNLEPIPMILMNMQPSKLAKKPKWAYRNIVLKSISAFVINICYNTYSIVWLCHVFH